MSLPAGDTVADALADLGACAANTTGFRFDALSAAALNGVLKEELAGGATLESVRAKANGRDPKLVAALHQAVSVGETFFFRQPEQFDLISTHLLRSRPQRMTGLRGWSAGCATGEEAYSLAACFLSTQLTPDAAAPSVLGTDLVERNILAARAATYRPWSVRSSAPIQHALFRRSEDELHRVADHLRAITQFSVRNLLDGAPPDTAPFDVILCRNVLVYFDREAADIVCAHLAEALAPDGIILFGSMDLAEPPPMLERIGSSEFQLFRRRTAPMVAVAAPPVRTATPAPPPAARRRELGTTPEPAREATPVDAHLEALLLIDKGHDREADDRLKALQHQSPGYVPGLLERALLCSRAGGDKASCELMREVIRLVGSHPLDEIVEGPQALPVRFYLASAEAFLEQARHSAPLSTG